MEEDARLQGIHLPKVRTLAAFCHEGLSRTATASVSHVPAAFLVPLSIQCKLSLREIQDDLRCVFTEYGLPCAIQTDREVVYGRPLVEAFPTLFTLWLVGLGVEHRFKRPNHVTDQAAVELRLLCTTGGTAFMHSTSIKRLCIPPWRLCGFAAQRHLFSGASFAERVQIRYTRTP
jgi:hypothetical protein